VSCDQAASVTVTGALSETLPHKRGKPTRHTFTLRASGTAAPGRTLSLTIRLPSAALNGLQQKASESVTFTLAARGRGGVGKASLKLSLRGA
jgi:hypothetical protein